MSTSEEEEIKILMAREIVQDICNDVGDARCYSILHRILVRMEGVEELKKLPEDVRRKIVEKVKEVLGVE